MSEQPTGTVTFLFTDVVDSSRLWERHPDAMHGAVAAHDHIVRDTVTANSGVVIKQTGDGAFAVFASALDAVTAAISIRQALGEQRWDPVSDFRVRIGVHTGEAHVRDGDYFGSAVNRAARITSIGTGGTILVSLTTEQLVRDRLPGDAVLRDLGEHTLQGLARPAHVFELGAADEATATRPVGSQPHGAAAGAASRAAWIAVLPFANLSGDPAQDYLADGITEDVITGLAAWSTLRVIARTTSLRYKGSEAGIDQIAAELGVRYVLEGSVRAAGDRIRVTAQLIEAAGQHHVWANRYDADAADLFAVQDEITRGIVVAIDPAIRVAETAPATRITPDDLTAWHHFQLGRSEAVKFKKKANTAAVRHFSAAVEIDPGYSAAWSSLAFAHFVDAWLNFIDDRQASLELAYREAKTALELDEGDAMAHAVMGFANFGMGRLEAAATAASRALELNPSLAEAHLVGGIARQYSGRAEESLPMFDETIALSPHHPAANFFYGARALSLILLHRYPEAATDARAAIDLRHGYVFGRIALVSALAHQAMREEAQIELAELLAVKPDLTPAVLDTYPFEDENDRRHIIEGLLLAGLPTGE